MLRACRARSKAFPQLGFSKRQVKHSAGLPNRSIAAKKRGSCRRTEDVAGLSGPWSGIVRSRAVPRGAAAGIPPQTVESLLVFHVKRLYAHACSAARLRHTMCCKNVGLAVFGGLRSRPTLLPEDRRGVIPVRALSPPRNASPDRAGTAKPAFLQHIGWRSLLNRD